LGILDRILSRGGNPRLHAGPVDALFVNPPSPDGFVYIRDLNRHGRSSWERMIWPQTSLAYLAAVAGTAGLTVDIVDCIAEGIDWPAYRRIVDRLRPRYCLANVISVTFANDLEALRVAKRAAGAVTIGMGPHLTNAPERSLAEADGLDFVIRHEAEDTLRELLAVLESGGAGDLDRLRRVEGIAFVPSRLVPGAGDEPVVAAQRPFIEDLDALPWPRHDLLPLGRYWAPFLGNYTFVEASRGCAYRCIFCRQAVMWQWKIRSRSGAALAEEALYVHGLGVDNILFHADTFTLDHRMVEDLCDRLIEAGTPFRWACNAHVRTLLKRPELVARMKRAGCWMIAIGIESGDDGILRNIKKQITAAEAEEVVRLVADAGIEVWGYFVLGFPGETGETMERTIRFALRLPLAMAKFDIAAPYPGTEFHDYVRRMGYLRALRHEDFDQNASAVVEYPDLSRRRIKAAVRKGNLLFYLKPRSLGRLLREATAPQAARSMVLIARDQFRLLGRKGRG
jgi:radical SAM superfamily enzyme YgiQ (UPF0313 family)